MRLLFIIISSFFLAGCFASSLTVVQSGIGASQGRMIQSSITPAFSFGVKQTTGKYPIEHVLKREKQRIIKKATEFENKVIKVANKTITTSKDTVLPIKNSFSDKVAKLNRYMLKDKTFSMKNFKHKPRFSYKPK